MYPSGERTTKRAENRFSRPREISQKGARVTISHIFDETGKVPPPPLLLMAKHLSCNGTNFAGVERPLVLTSKVRSYP